MAEAAGLNAANPERAVASAAGNTVHHPSALRNRIPILKQLMSLLPEATTGHALEIASSTGAHIEVFAPAFPSLTWHPSEYVPPTPASAEEQWPKYGKVGQRVVENDELLSIDAHGSAVFSNVVPAVALDLMHPYGQWPASIRELEGQFTLVILSNTLHITPWECSVGLFNGAAKLLSSGGKLVVYGPFKVEGKFVGADGGANNEKFDAKLRSTNESWGIRDVDDLKAVATPLGLILQSQVDMPANNLTLTFVKQ